MSGRVSLSPWVREVVSPEAQAAIRARVPDGYRLEVVTSDRRRYSARLFGPRGVVAEFSGPLDEALAAVLTEGVS